jgi:hypothetical protein
MSSVSHGLSLLFVLGILATAVCVVGEDPAIKTKVEESSKFRRCTRSLKNLWRAPPFPELKLPTVPFPSFHSIMTSSTARPRVFLDISIDGNAAGRIVIELFSDYAPKTSEK